MNSPRSRVADVSEKLVVNVEPSGEEEMAAFTSRLTSEELATLERFKASAPELCDGWNDAFLMRFLWARKMDIKRATELLRNHLEWRKRWDLDSLDADAVTAYLSTGTEYWTPGQYTKQGYAVWNLVPRKIDKEAMAKDGWLTQLGVRGWIHATYFMADTMLDHDLETARHGGVFVQDFSGTSFSTLMGIATGRESFDFKQMSEWLQNHVPFRARSFILVNCPWYIRMVIAAVKPLLKPKMRKKIIVYSGSGELDLFFTPEQLGKEFGGQFETGTGWVGSVLEKRNNKLSDGKYVDPSPRSPNLIRRYTGSNPIVDINELTANNSED